MIASLENLRAQTTEIAWEEHFLAMLPGIRLYARRAFRFLEDEARDEAVAETVANAFVAFMRLVERGKESLAYGSVLARFAVKQVREGRRVGGHLNTQDALCREAARRHGFSVGPLPSVCDDEGGWVDATQDDRQTPIPDQAAFRCDFPAWLDTYSARDRRIAEALALRHSTQEVADRFGVSSARISQLRRDFAASWNAFHGEATNGNASR